MWNDPDLKEKFMRTIENEDSREVKRLIRHLVDY